MGYNRSEHMESTKLLLLVAVILVGVGFLVFIVHTIRCYLNKPPVDDDDEFQVQYQRNDNLHPI